MKFVISMQVNPENDIVRAEFSVFEPDSVLQDQTVFQAAEITAEFLHKRLQEVNVPDTLEFDFQMHTDGTYHISVSVPSVKIQYGYIRTQTENGTIARIVAQI